MLSLLASPPLVNAQNLIPNGSFEDLWNPCENGSGYQFLDDWIHVDCAIDPGLLAECYEEVPSSSLGYQEALDGGAFIILVTFVEYDGPLSPGNNPLRYAHVLLTEPLVADQRYCLRMGVSLADSSSYRTSQLNAFFWYGENSRCASNDTLWDDYSQITFDISEVDTSGWTILEQDFVADGGENSLTLGAFQFGDEIDTVFIRHHELISGDMARYFVDDIRLEACGGVGVVEPEGLKVLQILGSVVREELVVRNNGSQPLPYTIHGLDGRLMTSGVFGAGESVSDVAMLGQGFFLIHSAVGVFRFLVAR